MKQLPLWQQLVDDSVNLHSELSCLGDQPDQPEDSSLNTNNCPQAYSVSVEDNTV